MTNLLSQHIRCYNLFWRLAAWIGAKESLLEFVILSTNYRWLNLDVTGDLAKALRIRTVFISVRAAHLSLGLVREDLVHPPGLGEKSTQRHGEAEGHGPRLNLERCACVNFVTVFLTAVSARSNGAQKLQAGLHVRRKHKRKHKPTCEPGRRKHKKKERALVLVLASSRFTRGLCLCLRRPGSQVAYARAWACVARVNKP